MANKFRAEVDAPEFGPGYIIRLDMAGQAELESEFGEFEFAGKVQIGLAVVSAKYVEAFLRVALRNDQGVLESPKDVPDAPLADIAKKCLDSFTMFRYGKDSETWAAENEKKAGKPPTSNPTKGTKA